MLKIATCDSVIEFQTDFGGAYVGESKVVWPFAAEEERRWAWLMARYTKFKRPTMGLGFRIPETGYLSICNFSNHRETTILVENKATFLAALSELGVSKHHN